MIPGLFWWAMRDLNPRPLPCEGSALPAAPIALTPRRASSIVPDPRAFHGRRRARHADGVSVCRCARNGLKSYECPGQPGTRGCSAVVAHHLAKVRVASSNLVIRSSARSSYGVIRKATTTRGPNPTRWRGRAARHRPAKPFTRVRIPSPPRRQLNSPFGRDWRSGSALP